MKQHKIKDDLEEENEALMRKIIVKYFHKTTLFCFFCFFFQMELGCVWNTYITILSFIFRKAQTHICKDYAPISYEILFQNKKKQFEVLLYSWHYMSH